MGGVSRRYDDAAQQKMCSHMVIGRPRIFARVGDFALEGEEVKVNRNFKLQGLKIIIIRGVIVI